MKQLLPLICLLLATCMESVEGLMLCAFVAIVPSMRNRAASNVLALQDLAVLVFACVIIVL